MRLSLFALPALAAFAFASPVSEVSAVEKRGTGSVLGDWLVDLNTQVKTLSAHMTQTAQAVPADASDDEKSAAAQSVIADINSITAAISSANSKITAVQKRDIEARQNLGNLPRDILGSLNGQPIVFARLLTTLVQELDPALQSVLVTLSLGEVYVALQPLLKVQLPLLVTNVGNLVNGLLVALAPLLAGVGGILAPLLLALGL